MPSTVQLPTKSRQVFLSRFKDFTVVRCPKLQPPGPNGGNGPVVSPGLRYDFVDNVFEVTPEVRKRDQRFLKKYGHEHTPDTLDDKWLPTEEWLLARGAETGDFHEMGLEPPSPNEVLQQITTLALDGDVEQLVALHVAEEAEHQRPEVLDTITLALERMEAPAVKE